VVSYPIQLINSAKTTDEVRSQSAPIGTPGWGPASVLKHTARLERVRIVGIDIAAPYIAYASTRSTDQRLTFLTGDAVGLDSPVGSFDRCFSLLALNFMSDPVRALAGMRQGHASERGSCRSRVGFCGWSGLSTHLLGYGRGARSRRRAGEGPTLLEPGPGELVAAFNKAGLRNIKLASLTVRLLSERKPTWP
jgi:hypothetical protein